MRVSTAVTRYNRAKGRLHGVFLSAIACHYTHDAMCKASADVINSTNDCPRWVRNKLSGYAEAWRDVIWKDKVEYCYIDHDGTRYSVRTDGALPSSNVLYSAGRGSEVAGMKHAHFWRGSDKAFTPLQTAYEANPLLTPPEGV